ncbi:MAG: 50S ribosomal protein L10 [Candidatus Kerfeldbacteria bacterium]
MAKTREQKEQELAVLNEKMEKSKGAVFANFMGLSVPEVQELRSNLKKEDSEMVVAKKNLVALMLEKAGLDKSKAKEMEGGISVVFGYDDEIAPARILAEYAKNHEALTFHGGILEGGLIDVDKVEALAKLPSRQQLLANMVGSLKSPISGFANVLGGNIRGLVQALNQIKEQKES